MKSARWVAIYVGTFLISFVLSIVFTLNWPSDFGGIEKVKWSDSVGRSYMDLPYAEGALNQFDLYVPADGSKRSYKLVLYIHAGGFTGGDKADDSSWAKYFVSKGYVAATINYTTNSQEHPSNVYKMSREIQRGVVAIRNEAAKRGYNLDEMAVAGGSAGGTLAMIYGYRDYAESPIAVKCVIEMVGPGSFEPTAWFGFDSSYNSDEEAKAGAAFVSTITGDEVTPDMMRSGEYKKALKRVSPEALVTKNTVPTLSAYGIYDKVAPFAASKGLLRALEDNGVAHDFIEFPKSGHALNRDPKQGDILVRKINEHLDKYLHVDRSQ